MLRIFESILFSGVRSDYIEIYVEQVRLIYAQKLGVKNSISKEPIFRVDREKNKK